MLLSLEVALVLFGDGLPLEGEAEGFFIIIFLNY